MPLFGPDLKPCSTLRKSCALVRGNCERSTSVQLLLEEFDVSLKNGYPMRLRTVTVLTVIDGMAQDQEFTRWEARSITGQFYESG